MADHIVAKPWLYHHNKPNISKGIGVGAVEAEGVEKEIKTVGDRGEGK